MTQTAGQHDPGRPAIGVDTRVTWDRGPVYGRYRGQGVVKEFEVYDGVHYCHVRWDDPGLDDEMVATNQLSGVRAQTLAEQPLPTGNGLPQIADLVKADIDDRRARGIETYGVPLQPMNNRSALQDLYEELLDGAHYARQRLEEERQHLAELAGDLDAPARVAEIEELASGLVQNAPETSAAHELAKGTQYLLQLLRAQGHELRLATQALVRTEHPPSDLEVAGYQYRVSHPNEDPFYDDCYDQDWIDRWCADPDGEEQLVEGCFPEYRPVYGGAWRPVDPERPPEQLPGGWSVPSATGTPAGASKPPETPPGLLLDIRPENSLPHLIRQIRRRNGLTQKQMADQTGISLATLVQVQNYYAPVDPYLITRMNSAFELSERELEHLVELAVNSSHADSCDNPDCDHAPSQHTRVWGCVRCACKAGQIPQT